KKVGGRCPPAPAAALRLPPQTESPDDLLVAFRAPTVQVGEQPSALSDHREQPPPAGVVTAGGPQMLGEVLDPLREERDLDLRRAGVFGVAAVRGDHLGLVGKGRRRHPLSFLGSFGSLIRLCVYRLLADLPSVP